MFDKLIESNSVDADFKPRRKFFMVSSVVVGIMFITAVVASLYAQDLDLGTNSFELVEMIAPVATDAPEPEPPKPVQQRNENQESNLPVRRDLTAHINHTTKVPDSISTTRNTSESNPETGRFIFDPNGRDSAGSSGPVGAVGDAIGSSSSEGPTVAEPVKLSEPPPAAKVAPKPSLPRSEGVINGKAKYLPNPAYPEPARRVGAHGLVNVQVTIDEEGKVISSRAIDGHPLLRGTAESAAWKARFSPTYLSKVPVKVTGVIVFNFKKN